MFTYPVFTAKPLGSSSSSEIAAAVVAAGIASLVDAHARPTLEQLYDAVGNIMGGLLASGRAYSIDRDRWSRVWDKVDIYAEESYPALISGWQGCQRRGALRAR